MSDRLSLEPAARPLAAEEPPLLPRIAAGDRSAANECIRRYERLVWSLARRMSPSVADAEDAVQEIFMQLWRQAGKFDPTRSPEPAFVVLLARRRLIDRLRARRQRQAAEVDLDPELVAALSASTSSVDDDADAEHAARLISELPVERQRVLALSLVYGFSHGQIAEQTGMPLGTVKSTVRRSLLWIRDQLGLEIDPRAPQGGAQ